jgi:hypothetical protein
MTTSHLGQHEAGELGKRVDWHDIVAVDHVRDLA